MDDTIEDKMDDYKADGDDSGLPEIREELR
jgi:hypothetical protein